jgi:hypothetical protein
LQKGFLSVNQTVYEGHFDEPKVRRSKRCSVETHRIHSIDFGVLKRVTEAEQIQLCGTQPTHST